MSSPDFGFEIGEHTADIKLHAWGRTLEGLFQAAAEGFYSIIGELIAADEGESLSIQLHAPDLTDLLHDWLSELLFRFEAHRLWLDRITFERLDEAQLHATGRARHVNIDRSSFGAEVKAVTYHGLHVERSGNRYEATVILDL